MHAKAGILRAGANILAQKANALDKVAQAIPGAKAQIINTLQGFNKPDLGGLGGGGYGAPQPGILNNKPNRTILCPVITCGEVQKSYLFYLGGYGAPTPPPPSGGYGVPNGRPSYSGGLSTPRPNLNLVTPQGPLRAPAQINNNLNNPQQTLSSTFNNGNNFASNQVRLRHL